MLFKSKKGTFFRVVVVELPFATGMLGRVGGSKAKAWMKMNYLDNVFYSSFHFLFLIKWD